MGTGVKLGAAMGRFSDDGRGLARGEQRQRHGSAWNGLESDMRERRWGRDVRSNQAVKTTLIGRLN
jgi:hypothetical protein